MNKFMIKVRLLYAAVMDLWNQLPHQLQAGIILFGTATLTGLGKELQAEFDGRSGFTWLSLRHDLWMAITAGILAVRAFYMLPNRPEPVTLKKESQ